MNAVAVAGANYEILVVNDASTDTTNEAIARVVSSFPNVRALENPVNLGMGGAFKTGLNAAEYSHTMVFPADNEHPEEGLLPILKARGEADMIIPYVLNPEVRARHRQVISKCYVGLINCLFFKNIPYYNGLVLHRVDLLRSVTILTNSFSYQTEAILKQLASGASWKAVGVPLHQPSHTKTKAFRLKNVLGVAMSIARLRLSLRL